MIKGIEGFQPNTIAFNRIQNDRNNAILKQAEEQQQQNVKDSSEQQGASRDLDLRLGEIKPRQNASLEDISLSLNESTSFEMKGRYSDIESLDMEKAVSDMQKDQALMQYQYFVGETNILNNEDGIVIPK